MMETIGFLGCGNMGGAIARAVCKAADPKKVYLANRTTAKAQALAKELGCKVATNAEVAAECDLIFLAVKPQMMEALLAPLKFSLDERPGRFVLCSMAAGLSIARIQEMAGEDFPVIRIMPNTPASVGEGMTKTFLLKSPPACPRAGAGEMLFRLRLHCKQTGAENQEGRACRKKNVSENGLEWQHKRCKISQYGAVVTENLL